MIKSIVKKILPRPIKQWLIDRKLQIELLLAYKYDYNRYYKYSGTRGYNNPIKLQGLIIKSYHIIEKGLTMPETRLGFGRDMILRLSDNCLLFIKRYGANDQIKHAIAVILEYRKFHEEKNYQLDDIVLNKIANIVSVAKQIDVCSSQQTRTTKEEYLKYTTSDFANFSNSRKSVRNYSTTETVSLELLNKVIGLSLNTPSACNRQTSRVYIYSDKQDIERVLSSQNGNRGFGNLADKVIVITVELGVFAYPMERNQAFIDGGMYAMNLLYCLHYHKIAACILNCSNTPSRDKEMRKQCGIGVSEAFIAMITCGKVPDEFSIAASKRYTVEDISIIKNL